MTMIEPSLKGDPSEGVQSVVTWLMSTRFSCGDEARLQAGIEQMLTRRGIIFQREVRLSASDRIDFLVADGIGIECKVDGSPSAVVSQLLRYMQHEAIRGLVLVTARLRLGHCLPGQVAVTGKDGVVLKPLQVAALWKGGL